MDIIIDRIEQKKLIYYGHVQKMGETRWFKKGETKRR